MNRGVYRHYMKQIAERKELLDKLKVLMKQYQIRDLNQLLTLLDEYGVKTDLQTITRELQGLQVKKNSAGTYVLPDEAEIHGKRQLLKEVFNQSAVDVSTKVDFLAIKTPPSHEATTASVIEDAFDERILGTVVGRGVVFVVAKDDTVGREALQKIVTGINI